MSKQELKALSNRELVDLVQATHAELQDRVNESNRMKDRINDMILGMKRINARWDALIELLETEAVARDGGRA